MVIAALDHKLQMAEAENQSLKDEIKALTKSIGADRLSTVDGAKESTSGALLERSERPTLQHKLDGQFRVSLPTQPPFLSEIHGTKGKARERLERSTNTDIQIPSLGQVGDVIVTGFKLDDVYKLSPRLGGKLNWITC